MEQEKIEQHKSLEDKEEKKDIVDASADEEREQRGDKHQ